MKKLLSRAEMLAVVNTQYASLLSPSEYRVLMFIYQRTYGFGKAAETIPLRHFINGVTSRAGDLITHGVGLQRRRIIQILQTLANMQVITVAEDNRRGNTYSINPMLAMMGAPMKRPKKLTHYRNPGALECTAPVHFSAPPIGNIDNRIILSNTSYSQNSAGAIPVPYGSTPSPGKASLAAIVAATTDKHRAARAANKAKLNATGIIKLWYDCVMKYRPDLAGQADAIEFPKYTMTNIRQVISRGVDVEKLPEFFDFVCGGWDELCRRVFGKNSQLVGKAPDIRVVIKYINELYAAFLKYADDKSFLAARAATPQQVQRLRTETQVLGTQVQAERTRAENEARRANLLALENAKLRSQLQSAPVAPTSAPKPLKSRGFTPLKPRTTGVAPPKEPGQNLQTIAARLGLKPYE